MIDFIGYTLDVWLFFAIMSLMGDIFAENILDEPDDVERVEEDGAYEEHNFDFEDQEDKGTLDYFSSIFRIKCYCC